ncbi:MAG: ABC transporter ATP-binding protein [Thermoanaerobaculum sp.]|nr:ABC transporter ATP-binding protein [Thermoanaerobaculum sp.]MDW7966526.1 ABC transporter ATP-binding protein [Thermoanaerobaculum sp.]
MVAEQLPQEVIQAQRVWLSYGARPAVAGVSFAVRRGTSVALVGPDGAGKTSLLRAAAGLQPVHRGQLLVFGLPAWEERYILCQHLGYVPQSFALYEDLSVDENLAFVGQIMGVGSWRARRDQLLHRLGLAPFRHRRAQDLSGGMKQKLALAASLMHEPGLLVLDEPTTGVDPISRREYWQLLSEVLANGVTVLWATPYLDEAQRAQEVVLLHHGQVVAQGEPSQLARQSGLRVVYLEGHPRQALRSFLEGYQGVLDVQPFALGFHVFLDQQAPPLTQEALAPSGATILHLEEREPSLEDLFLAKIRLGSGVTQP